MYTHTHTRALARARKYIHICVCVTREACNPYMARPYIHTYINKYMHINYRKNAAKYNS